MKTPSVCNSSHSEDVVRDLITSHPPYTVVHPAQDIACCRYIILRVVRALFTVCHHKLVREFFIFLWSLLLTHHWEPECSQTLMNLSPLWAIISFTGSETEELARGHTAIFAHGQAELQVRAQWETSSCAAQQKCVHLYQSCPASCSFHVGKHLGATCSETQKIKWNLPRNCNSIIFISGFDTLINTGKLRHIISKIMCCNSWFRGYFH